MIVYGKPKSKRFAGLEFDVYDVSYDTAGYPHFLIYHDGQWLRQSAKWFTPLWRESTDETQSLKLMEHFKELFSS